MKNYKIFYLLLLALPLSAKILISPIDAMQYSYGKDSQITKENVLLSKEQVQTIEQTAKVKLETKIYRIFKASKDNKTLGYGILINKKIRSKNGVVLYIIDDNSLLKGIEIIAFNEPLEYLPSKEWNSQFQNIETSKMLRLSKEIPTITGATLSARSITDSSRIAFAIYNEVIKEKQ